jgi:hypothetical protein
LGKPLEDFWNAFADKLIRFPVPVITAVNGVAAGAGASIALSTDFIIMEKSAFFQRSPGVSISSVSTRQSSARAQTLPRGSRLSGKSESPNISGDSFAPRAGLHLISTAPRPH